MKYQNTAIIIIAIALIINSIGDALTVYNLKKTKDHQLAINRELVKSQELNAKTWDRQIMINENIINSTKEMR